MEVSTDKYQILLDFSRESCVFDAIPSIILTAEKVKPASSFPVFFKSDQDLYKFIETVRSFGLVVFFKIEKYHNLVKGEISISRSEKFAKIVYRFMSSRSGFDMFFTNYGKLMGYPDTAIKAFDKERLEWDNDEELSHILKNDLDREELIFYTSFTPFILSKKHWKTELQVVREWFRVLKLSAPVTCDALMRRK